MYNKSISYSSVVYSITKGFIDKNSAEFYLYWQDKIDGIDISNLSIVDKVFVLMCNRYNINGILRNLETEYNIKINEDDVYNILVKCQCFDIEITIMAKSFFRYKYMASFIDEQIDYIQEHSSIDLPYTYDIIKKE